MKKIVIFLSCCLIVFIFSSAYSQDKKQENEAPADGMTQLTSEQLEEEGKKLDEEIERIYQKINEVLVTYKLFELNDIKYLPYRVTYNKGDDFIEIEKYEILRDTFLFSSMTGINKKKIKAYISGNSVSKMESVIVEQHLFTGTSSRVLITDPSPKGQGTDDISFSYVSRNVNYMEDKKLGEVKNNVATPLRNDIKKKFLIPHVTFLYDTLLDIAETYYKGLKDSDKILLEFLNKATKY